MPSGVGQDERQPFPVNGEVKRPKKKKKKNALPVDMMCGLGPCHPVILQGCARMGCFVGAYSLCGLMTSILSMYIVSQITTIEKQFGFSSSQSGFLLSCNDIGYLLTTVFFSYIARKVHIPRTLWLCTVLYGVAGLICSLSYFISKDHVEEQAQLLFTNGKSNPSGNISLRQPSGGTPMCTLRAESSTNASKCDTEKAQKTFGIGVPNEFSQIALVLIAIGMMIQGLGKAPRYPFLTTYVDDNVKKKNTAMYMGIVSGVGIFGPAIAFSVGGLFSRQYVTLEEVPITPRHPAWIGAWWLGFVIFGCLSMVLATPLMFFPKRLRPKIPTPKHRGGRKASECMRAIKDFLKALVRLLTNKVYVPLVLSTCITLFSVAGMVAFSAKYLETQFFIPAWKANILLGAMNVVAASAGTIVGGFVVTKRQLTPLACIKVTIVVNCLGVIIVGLGYVFGCTNAEIVGYNKQSEHAVLNASCSDACGCDNTTYFPVCGSDNVNYMSPCHAGCQKQNGTLFIECGCVGNHGNASAGICDTSCPMLYPFLIANIFGAFFSTLSMMPMFIVLLRSVSETDKPLAVGFSALLSTLCGWFAGPVVFGMMIDTTCLIWSVSCSGEKGACALYDNDDLRVKKHTFEIVPRLIVVFLYIGVFFIARRKSDWSVDNPDDSEVDGEDVIMNGDQDLSMGQLDSRRDPIYKGSRSPETITFKSDS